MMEQYFKIKEKHSDALLFYRLGDFYEMFYEDAKTASPVLEIALTSRQGVPMCGVPYHAANTYLTKLLKEGFRVAVCEQVEDPKQSRGVVRREVVKVLTPGTAVELELQDAKESNYIMSLVLEEGQWGLAMVDLATGNLRTTQSSPDVKRNLADEVFRVLPREILFPEKQQKDITRLLEIDDPASVLTSAQEDWVFDLHQTRNLLKNHFQVKTLSGFELEEKPLAVRASGALLFYLKNLRKDALILIDKIIFEQHRQFMTLDATSIKNLELVRNLRDGKEKGSLLDVIDFTVTAVGGRLMRFWLLHPLLDCSKIRSRLEVVAELLEHIIERQEMRESLKGIFDLERLTSKISLAVANARDLISLKRSLKPLPEIQSLVKGFSSKQMKAFSKGWDNAEDLVDLIENAVLDEPSFQLTEGGIIADGFNKELDGLREVSRSGKSYISALEKKERKKTGISSLKVRYNKVFGYYIDVTKPNLSHVPEEYIRKQTLVNSERFITPELKEYEEKVLNAEQRIAELEYDLFQGIREQIAENIKRLRQIADVLACIDVFSALAEIAAQRKFKCPEVKADDVIDIKDGRHPVIEWLNDEPFIPNDTYMDCEGDQVLIVTGPNMGGKSTYLRQVALICILAQMGSFIPASQAKIGLVDRIFTRIGAMDFLSAGQSTFMVEMLETASILVNATPMSLILLDEIGRGTSTFDGLSIAWAVTEYLHENSDVHPKTLFATHYHELTELSLTLPRIKNYHVSVKEQKGEVTFLRKIIPGPSDQSYGIHVAKLAGIPRAVIDRAKEILFNLEKKELDGSGIPRIAYHSSQKRDSSQLFLFLDDREKEVLLDLKSRILEKDPNALTPLEALSFLCELREIIKKDGENI